MADPVLTDVKACEFKGIALMGALTDWSDTLQQRLAVKQFLKVPGASVEWMGDEPVRIEMTLVYLGDNWRKDYTALRASIRDNPKGLLVHPLLGQIRVACEGIHGARVVPGEARNLVTVPISFVEDSLNVRVVADQVQKSVGEKQQKVTAANTTFSAQAAQFVSLGAVAASAALTSASSTYALAAAASAASNALDSSLSQKLDGTANATGAAVAAIRVDPVAKSDAFAYAAIVSAEQVYAACLDLADALQLRRPALERYVVPALTNIGALCALLYGRDARGRIEEVLSYNPGKIPNPAAIRGGVELDVPLRTV